MKWFRRYRTVRSERLAQRKRKILLWKLGGVAVVIISFIILSSWVLHRPYLQINEFVVNGNSVISSSDLENIAKKVLDGKYFSLFPRTNSLIYPEKEIETSILTTFKQIESVDLVRMDFQTLSMEIREQSPHALWCVEKIEEAQSCYFLNKEGFIFSSAPNFTGNVFLRFYGDLEEADPIGMYYLKANNEFNKINVLTDSIKKLGLEPIELRTLGETDMELYMEDGSKIVFTHEQRPSEVLDNLKIVLESETFQNKEMKNIEYIDLRFGNKVYFKLK